MIYTISNEKLTVEISPKGGELYSIKDAKGKEYLWQGDEKTWTDRAPNLFPYIGRMTDGKYVYDGKEYHMDIHGFLPYMEMTKKEQAKDSLTLSLNSNEETKKQYPFEFELDITWKLTGATLKITYAVKNTDQKKMYFGVGGHPGFQIPIEEGHAFEDYRVDFGEGAKPRRILLSEDCFVLEKDIALPLDKGRYLPLRHDLFDEDALVLKEMPKEVRLNSEKGTKEIRIRFEQMDYLGIWHWPHVKVDYACIEPWSSLPSRKNVVEDIAAQPGMQILKSGELYTNTWSIAITDRTAEA